jgi:hypothetical protein
MAILQDPKQRHQNKTGSVDVIPESGQGHSLNQHPISGDTAAACNSQARELPETVLPRGQKRKSRVS